jgi:hypothetical protein
MFQNISRTENTTIYSEPANYFIIVNGTKRRDTRGCSRR